MSLEERGRALEEAFFAQKNKELLEKVKQELNASEQRAALQAATGVTDDDVLNQLLTMGVEAESMAALSIAPLVLVAWADGDVAEREREAILSAAGQHGIEPGTAAAELLQGWLTEKPDPSLEATWIEYTRSVCEKLQAGDHITLRERIIVRCKEVAEAAGGFLGIGSISVKEQKVLSNLETAFDPQ